LFDRDETCRWLRDCSRSRLEILGRRAMLQNLSQEIRECFRRAEECKRLTKTALTA